MAVALDDLAFGAEQFGGKHAGAVHIQPLIEAVSVERIDGRCILFGDLCTQLFQMCSVDLTRIDGIDVSIARMVVSEAGVDMGRFPTDKHFASWLGLCPGTKTTGGKVMSGKTKRGANRAAQALRLAAAALRSSQSALGAYYRRMCARMNKPKAVTSAAHKLAKKAKARGMQLVTAYGTA